MWTRMRCIAGAGRSPRSPGTWDMTARPSAPTCPATGSPASERRTEADPFEPFVGYCRERLAEDPHLWATTLLDAKTRVINALRPLTPADTVRGQYDGYREVAGVDPASTTESYVAVRLALDSWRWAGVPILIRAGKTLPVTATEVSIRFHQPPHDLFGVNDPAMTNALRFRIWPETRMTLALAGKKPGAGRIPQLQELSFAEEPGSDMRPYDRLIGAALDGNRLPFARQDAENSVTVPEQHVPRVDPQI